MYCIKCDNEYWEYLHFPESNKGIIKKKKDFFKGHCCIIWAEIKNWLAENNCHLLGFCIYAALHVLFQM